MNNKPPDIDLAPKIFTFRAAYFAHTAKQEETNSYRAKQYIISQGHIPRLSFSTELISAPAQPSNKQNKKKPNPTMQNHT